MADSLSLDLVERGLVTDQIVLTVGYDIENLTDEKISKNYSGEVVKDHYGRLIPKHAHGTFNLERRNSSSKLITSAVMQLYDRIVNEHLLVRRINLTAGRVLPVSEENPAQGEQLNLFSDSVIQAKEREKQDKELLKERSLQKAISGIKKKYGKNSMLKCMNLEEGATAKE